MINIPEEEEWLGADTRVFYKIINSFKIHFFLLRRECVGAHGIRRFVSKNIFIFGNFMFPEIIKD